MESFEELGLGAALVEALAAEGVERPTAFQHGAIPVIRRGNNLVGHVGPGSGALLAYGSAILDRLDPEGGPLRALVLTPTAEAAERSAEVVARLAAVTGHSVAALGSPWALPEHASILFGTPDDVLSAIRASRLKLDAVEALVLDEAAAMEALGALPAVEAILEAMPAEAQRVVLALPLGASLERLVDGHVRKAVHLPPQPVEPGRESEAPRRGTLSYVVRDEDRDDAILRVVSEALTDEIRHVLVFSSSEDRAADIGDFLALHGFQAGAPGDPSAPVWLGVDERDARVVLADLDAPESVATLSGDVPGDADVLDRRHGSGGPATVLVTPRQLPHLKDTAKRAGYTLEPAPAAPPARRASGLERLRTRIERALSERDLLGEMVLLEPLFDRWSAAEVAAAVLALLRDRSSAGETEAAESAALGSPPVRHPSTWARLFLGIGARDGVGPGDLLGAISGEAGVEGSRVGKIDIRESFSLVEVDPSVAETVIRGLNGITIRGRSVRADYDRGARTGRSQRGRRGTAAQGGKPRGGPPSRGDRPRPERPGRN